MRLHEFVNEIFDIADKNRDTDKGASTKFMTNVDRGTNYYPGAEDVDWAALKPESANFRKSAFTFYKALQAKGTEARALHDEGKRAEAKALIENYN